MAGQQSAAGAIGENREGYLTPNDVHETALVLIDELDKGVSKSQLARRAGVSRMTVMRIDENSSRMSSVATPRITDPPAPKTKTSPLFYRLASLA